MMTDNFKQIFGNIVHELSQQGQIGHDLKHQQRNFIRMNFILLSLYMSGQGVLEERLERIKVFSKNLIIPEQTQDYLQEDKTKQNKTQINQHSLIEHLLYAGPLHRLPPSSGHAGPPAVNPLNQERGLKVKQVNITTGIQTGAFDWTSSSYQKVLSGEREA